MDITGLKRNKFSLKLAYEFNRRWTPMQETTILSCHRYLINTGVEKMNNIYM
jgi:hypothetical protein